MWRAESGDAERESKREQGESMPLQSCAGHKRVGGEQMSMEKQFLSRIGSHTGHRNIGRLG